MSRSHAPLVLQGDARHLDRLDLETGSIDCFITSPPYHRLKRYGTEVAGEIGSGQTYAEYLDAMRLVFVGCSALAKPDGVMWLVADTLRGNQKTNAGELLPLPFVLAELAQEAGWRLQDVVIWKKDKTIPYSGAGKLRNLLEYVLLLTKSRDFKHRPFRLAERHLPGAEWLAGWPERYHPLGRSPSNVWTIPIPTQGMWAHTERFHFCPFPPALVARCIELTTDKSDVVMDPFSGIGTVPAQAIAMGRRGVGVEIHRDYIDQFEQRVLPSVQAQWEAESELRTFARQDQEAEAEVILKLRALKLGKELLRLVQRWAQDRPATDPSGAVEGVIVIVDDDLAGCIDVTSGEVSRPGCQVLLLADLEADSKNELLREAGVALESSRLKTLGFEVSLEAIDPTTVNSAGFLVRGDREIELSEFSQSRRGAMTAPIVGGRGRPSLMTNIELPRALVAEDRDPLERVRRDAEKQLLLQELALGGGSAGIADRLGVPRATVEQLLEDHQIGDGKQAFGIPIDLPTG
jgi:DNA modification methylase